MPMPEGSDSGGPCKPDPCPTDPGKPAPGLHLVATPIGNLKDITLRAIETLAGADLIACEDTRITARLMARYGLSTTLLPYHEHNAAEMRPRLLARLSTGAAVALVSDAGTPLISDPGWKLVQACHAAGIAVTALPGANAALTALQLSGLPTDRFLFCGFLPPRPAARQKAIGDLKPVAASLVFYESAPRLEALLADLAAVLGPRPAAVARELTKRFEEVRRAPLPELAAHYAALGPPKGELVVVVGPPADSEGVADQQSVDEALCRALADGASVRDAVAEVVRQSGWPRRQVYARALELERRSGDDRDP
jgi:16S rRNA (cytidine1402-2'-O)-methyltransferase